MMHKTDAKRETDEYSDDAVDSASVLKTTLKTARRTQAFQEETDRHTRTRMFGRTILGLWSKPLARRNKKKKITFINREFDGVWNFPRDRI